jgi:hypothetical protein
MNKPLTIFMAFKTKRPRLQNQYPQTLELLPHLMIRATRVLIFLVLVVFVLPGCGAMTLPFGIGDRYLLVAFHSSPQGATLYRGNKKFGLTPQVVKYKITEKDQQQGYMIVSEMRVLWLSGAEAHRSSIQIPLKEFSTRIANRFIHGAIHGDYQFMFERPLVPGLETDTMYETQREILKAAKASEQAARRAETAANNAENAANNAGRAANNAGNAANNKGPCTQRWSNGVLYCR